MPGIGLVLLATASRAQPSCAVAPWSGSPGAAAQAIEAAHVARSSRVPPPCAVALVTDGQGRAAPAIGLALLPSRVPTPCAPAVATGGPALATNGPAVATGGPALATNGPGVAAPAIGLSLLSPPPLSAAPALGEGGARASGGRPAGQDAGSAPRQRSRAARAELAALAEQLDEGRPGERRVAVRALAELDSRPAWELVIGALADGESEVADAAQIALGSLRDARLIAELTGPLGLRAREPATALRVAESFGRMGVELDGELLVERAAQAEPEVARLLLWSVERLHGAGLLGGEPPAIVLELDRLVRSSRDAGTRAAALSAFGKLDYFLARERVLEAIEERDPVLRCAALSVAAGYAEAEMLALSARGLADREPRVRCQALENLEGLASRAALTALADHLGVETSVRLRWRMRAFLQARSGLDNGFDAAAWRAWAATVSSAVVTGEARAWPSGDTRVLFAGLPMLSERSAFLIDFSGSMWQTKIGERTRKEIVDAHLRGVLQSLPPEARFNVIPFTNEPIPWEERLVPASRANVARAVDWFERARQSGRGNFHDAALLALADPEVDTIVVLTDGVPTGGRHSNLELVVALLWEANRFRKVAFDAVLVDAPAGRRRLWEDLARQSGGRSVSVGLEDLAKAK